MSDKNTVNPHEGHRERMKGQFREHGMGFFQDHQVLEMLLFYAIPKKDTNETAHALLDKFGSLDKVLEADYEELMTVKGVKENSATLIRFVQALAQRYVEATFSYDGVAKLNDAEKLKDYCKNLFKGEKDEVIYAIALDSELTVVDKKKLNVGIANQVELPFRKLTEFAFKCNCTRLVLSHNHPNGSMIASRADINATEKAAELLANVDIEIVDHIVVGKNGVSSIKECNPDCDAWFYFNEFNV